MKPKLVRCISAYVERLDCDGIRDMHKLFSFLNFRHHRHLSFDILPSPWSPCRRHDEVNVNELLWLLLRRAKCDYKNFSGKFVIKINEKKLQATLWMGSREIKSREFTIGLSNREYFREKVLPVWSHEHARCQLKSEKMFIRKAKDGFHL